MQDEITRIAHDIAEQEAMRYVEQEKDRDKPAALDFVAYSIKGRIAMALSEAGYGFHALDVAERETIARDALARAGYLDLESTRTSWRPAN